MFLPQLVGTKQIEMFNNVNKRKYSRLDLKQNQLYHGEWFEVNVYPHHEGISINSHDISERKKAEDGV